MNELDGYDETGAGSCGARTRALYPYNFSFEGKKLSGIADEGYARSKLRY